MADRLVIYAVDHKLITGSLDRETADRISSEFSYHVWAENQPARPELKLLELRHILYKRLVPHGTYSMQQSDFIREGFEVDPRGQILLPINTYVVGLETRDRYDIFAPTEGLEIVTYETLEEWRAERDYEKEGWLR